MTMNFPSRRTDSSVPLDGESSYKGMSLGEGEKESANEFSNSYLMSSEGSQLQA